MDVTLSTNRNSNLNDVSWHPRGETAFITGDLGVALRYTTDNHTNFNFERFWCIAWGGYDFCGVEASWRLSYFGGSDGSIWKFSEGSGMTALDGTRTSPISIFRVIGARMYVKPHSMMVWQLFPPTIKLRFFQAQAGTLGLASTAQTLR